MTLLSALKWNIMKIHRNNNDTNRIHPIHIIKMNDLKHYSRHINSNKKCCKKRVNKKNCTISQINFIKFMLDCKICTVFFIFHPLLFHFFSACLLLFVVWLEYEYRCASFPLNASEKEAGYMFIV